MTLAVCVNEALFYYWFSLYYCYTLINNIHGNISVMVILKFFLAVMYIAINLPVQEPVKLVARYCLHAVCLLQVASVALRAPLFSLPRSSRPRPSDRVVWFYPFVLEDASSNRLPFFLHISQVRKLFIKIVCQRKLLSKTKIPLFRFCCSHFQMFDNHILFVCANV